MSDRYNDFDNIFRDRLRDQTAMPPDAVWSNIQAERSFGHIVANKISSSWRIIGTLLLLTIAGGTSAYLYQDEERDSIQLVQKSVAPENTSAIIYHEEQKMELQAPAEAEMIAMMPKTADFNQQMQLANDAFAEIQPDLLASSHHGGFGKPNFEDSHLAVLLEEMDGWETAKPASIIRFYNLNEIEKKSIDGNKIVKSPLIPEKKWDYVIIPKEEKTFRDRASLHFYMGPQFINKVLTAEYNMKTSFLEERLETENTRLAYSFGVNFQYELKNHKFFEGGLQFTQIYEEVHIDGDKRFSNQYDFLEIPLLIGYQNRESKWGWFIKGGFGVQVYNNYKGYILKRVEDRITVNTPQQEENTALYRMSGSNAVKNIVTNNHKLSEKQDRSEVYDLSSSENPYKKAGVVNVHMAAGLTYFHSINTSFTMTPYFKQGVNSLTKESAVFNERISYMGIMFGTQVKF